MNTRFLHTVALVVLATCSALALAQTSGRVGRISLTQGQVNISGEPGDEVSAALVNWPVTSHNQISTGRGARTEIRIGSTSVRLDADSALDVSELDDDSLRLHLHYGSASVRVLNPDAVRGFEMSTPQGVVRLQEPGRLRVDAGLRQDTTVVSVFDGVALVDGGGSRLTIRAGKRAEIDRDDVRTGLAVRDSFDEWAMWRDERYERSASVRYVTSEMTGYEDLDQNGVWRDDSEYGPLWSPRAIPLGWAPYRDGSWTWVQPWGWTWVDNAPWGYAPFHYGRWVNVNRRWCWSPGRNVTRVFWAPALVGWVGGSNWNLSFRDRGTHRAAPAQGWYPLAPHDTYVPTYRVAHENLRYLNHDGQSGRPHDNRRFGDNQRLGMTILPHDTFAQRRTVAVRGAPQAIVSATSLLHAPVAIPPAPLVVRHDAGNERGNGRGNERGNERRDGRIERDPRIGRTERGTVPAAPVAAGSVQSAVPPGAPRPAPLVGTLPVTPGVPLFRRDERTNNPDARRPRMETPTHMPTPAPAMPPQAAPLVLTAPTVALPVPPQVQRRDERGGRFERGDGERRDRRNPDPSQAAPLVLTAPTVALPVPPQAQQRDERGGRFERGDGERRDRRDPDPERDRRARGAEPFQPQVTPVARPAPQPMQPPVQHMAPPQQAMPPMQPPVQHQAPPQQAMPPMQPPMQHQAPPQQAMPSVQHQAPPPQPQQRMAPPPPPVPQVQAPVSRPPPPPAPVAAPARQSEVGKDGREERRKPRDDGNDRR